MCSFPKSRFLSPSASDFLDKMKINHYWSDIFRLMIDKNGNLHWLFADVKLGTYRYSKFILSNESLDTTVCTQSKLDFSSASLQCRSSFFPNPNLVRSKDITSDLFQSVSENLNCPDWPQVRTCRRSKDARCVNASVKVTVLQEWKELQWTVQYASIARKHAFQWCSI
jgi:hypothetical protein